MNYEIVFKAAIRCRCAHCGHRWEADRLPYRCARCKARTWTGDSDAALGITAPQVPAAATLLDTFSEVRRVFSEVIDGNPSPRCNHSRGICYCPERRALTGVDEFLEILRGSRLKRAPLYLIQRGKPS